MEIFFVPVVNQVIISGDGKKIHLLRSTTSLNQIDFQPNTTLILKHNLLRHWGAYTNIVKYFYENKGNKKELAENAVKQYEILKNTNFFTVYPKFEDFCSKKHGLLAWHAEGIYKYMAKAAENHFFTKYIKNGGDLSNFSFIYEPRPTFISTVIKGTRTAILVHVERFGLKTTYQVKCHHYGSINFSKNLGSNPEIRELFMYKLLDYIKVAPSVEFVFQKPYTGTKNAVYICTEWRADFMHLADVVEKKKDINIDPLIELVLLHLLFDIKDFHQHNVGVWETTQTAAIVDLQIESTPYSLAKLQPADLLNCFCETKFSHLEWPDEVASLLSSANKQTRIKVARAAICKWKLLEALDRTYEYINKERETMKTLGINFRGNFFMGMVSGKATDDFKEYVETLKKIVTNMMNALSMNVPSTS